MAHEIERIMENGKQIDCFAYVGKDAWHGLGQKLADATDPSISLAQMEKAARSDWMVNVTPVYAEGPRHGESGPSVKGYRAVVRDSDGKPLSVVSDKYELLQHNLGASVLDMLVSAEQATWETVGVLHGGKRLFYAVRLKVGSEPLPGDRHDFFIVFTTSHDGSLVAQYLRTAVRVVCQNTLSAALLDAGKSIRIYHRGDMDAAIKNASNVLALAHGDASRYDKAMTELAGITFGMKAAQRFLDTLIPVVEPVDEKTEDLRDKALETQGTIIRLHSEGLGVREFKTEGTAYGWLNAVTEYVHVARPRVRNRIQDGLLGDGAKLGREAFDMLTTPARRELLVAA